MKPKNQNTTTFHTDELSGSLTGFFIFRVPHEGYISLMPIVTFARYDIRRIWRNGGQPVSVGLANNLLQKPQLHQIAHSIPFGRCQGLPPGAATNHAQKLI